MSNAVDMMFVFGYEFPRPTQLFGGRGDTQPEEERPKSFHNGKEMVPAPMLPYSTVLSWVTQNYPTDAPVTEPNKILQLLKGKLFASQLINKSTWSGTLLSFMPDGAWLSSLGIVLFTAGGAYLASYVSPGAALVLLGGGLLYARYNFLQQPLAAAPDASQIAQFKEMYGNNIFELLMPVKVSNVENGKLEFFYVVRNQLPHVRTSSGQWVATSVAWTEGDKDGIPYLVPIPPEVVDSRAVRLKNEVIITTLVDRNGILAEDAVKIRSPQGTPIPYQFSNQGWSDYIGSFFGWYETVRLSKIYDEETSSYVQLRAKDKFLGSYTPPPGLLPINLPALQPRDEQLPATSGVREIIYTLPSGMTFSDPVVDRPSTWFRVKLGLKFFLKSFLAGPWSSPEAVELGSQFYGNQFHGITVSSRELELLYALAEAAQLVQRQYETGMIKYDEYEMTQTHLLRRVDAIRGPGDDELVMQFIRAFFPQRNGLPPGLPSLLPPPSAELPAPPPKDEL